MTHPQRNSIRGPAAVALLSLWLLSTPAQAGRPLQTEDAGVLDPGACEIEGAHLRTTLAGQRETEATLGLGCGLGWRSQLGIGLSRARVDGSSATGGQLGGKTALWQGEGEDGVALTLAWSLGWDRGADGRWTHSSQALNAVASVPAGPGSVHLNMGHARDRVADAVSTTWGLAYEHEGVALGTVHWAPMAELFGDDRGSRWVNLALRATVVAERVFLDLSVGRQLGGDKARLVTVGFKLAF